MLNTQENPKQPRANPTTIRFSFDSIARLERLMEKNGIRSKRDFLERLLITYEAQGGYPLQNTPTNDQNWLEYKLNLFATDNEKVLAPKHFMFKGIYLYGSPENYVPLSNLSSAVYDVLKIDFCIDDNLDTSKYFYSTNLLLFACPESDEYYILDLFHIDLYTGVDANFTDITTTDIHTRNKIYNKNLLRQIVVSSTIHKINGKDDYAKFMQEIKPYYSASDVMQICLSMIEYEKNNKNS